MPAGKSVTIMQDLQGNWINFQDKKETIEEPKPRRSMTEAQGERIIQLLEDLLRAHGENPPTRTY